VLRDYHRRDQQTTVNSLTQVEADVQAHVELPRLEVVAFVLHWPRVKQLLWCLTAPQRAQPFNYEMHRPDLVKRDISYAEALCLEGPYEAFRGANGSQRFHLRGKA
jgi:hypothetical protein